MSQPIITGILSYGMSGRLFHAPFVDANSDFEFHAVTERSQKQAAQRYPQVVSYNSVDELIHDPKVELVIVNTPNNTHYDFAKRALLAGKHVLVEKPFAASSAEAKELFDIAKEKGLKAMAYQNRRWDSDFLSVKSVIESGKLGRLIEVHFRFDRYRPEISKKTFKEEPLPASGLSYDLGPHLLDQIISLFGVPLSHTKSTGVFREGSLVDDYFHFHLRYPNGLNVFASSGLLITQPLPSFVLHGTNGTYIKNRVDVQEEQLLNGISPALKDYGLEPEGVEGQLTTIGANGHKSVEYIPSLRGNYNRLFDAVCECIRNDKPFPITEDDIMLQMEILEGNKGSDF